MKRLFALATLVSSLYAANKINFTPANQPEPQNKSCSYYDSDKLIAYYTTDGREYAFRYVGDVEEFDINCDGTPDLIRLIRNVDDPSEITGEPVVYLSRDESSGIPIGSYYDPREDGFNGNEIKCDSLDDCIGRVLKFRNGRKQACVHNFRRNGYKFS